VGKFAKTILAKIYGTSKGLKIFYFKKMNKYFADIE
jgi:hypothetical protein